MTEMSGNPKLPFDDLLHQLDTNQNPSSVIKLLEAKHRLHAKFYTPMILHHYVIQVLTRTDLYRVFPPVIEFVADAHPAQRAMARFEAV
jgi:hypothetical protein